MKCPVDGNDLEYYMVDSVEVEKCPECQGLWFTKREIRLAEEAARKKRQELEAKRSAASANK